MRCWSKVINKGIRFFATGTHKKRHPKLTGDGDIRIDSLSSNVDVRAMYFFLAIYLLCKSI